MFANILVPVDLSGKNKKAVEIAVQMALSGKGSVNLIHVIETLADTDFAEIKEFYNRLEERAWKELDALMAPHHDSGADLSAKVAYGRRAERILSFARESGTDLIVMNSHKVRAEDPIQGWGTISYKVGVLAQCPILLVK